MRHERLSAEVVRAALEARAEDLFRELVGEPEKAGAREWRARASSAIAMVMRGPKRGLWRDYKTGERGDVLDFLAVHRLSLARARDDFPRTMQEAAAWAGIALAEPVNLEAAAAERKRRAEAEAAERQTAAQAKAKLVAELRGLARPVGGTPAAAYLAGRGLAQIPADAMAYLPALPRRAGLMHPQREALVVWARDDTGRVLGGQRILILPDGGKAPEAQRKPSFGQVSGFPARFPARPPHADDAPLLVAEGPESAQAVWQATGLETWATFGAGFFGTAPLPLGRRVILCPDRDAPDSPAARAFADAVAHHLGRGCDLWQADAPEPEGSKGDLADTLLRDGEAAVRGAVAAARSLRPTPQPPFHPGPQGDRRAALEQHPAAIERFFGEAFPMIRAAKKVARGYADLPPELEPRERAKRQRAIRREAQERFGLGYLPTPQLRKEQGAPRVMIGGAQGVGKTRSAARMLLLGHGLVTLVLTPGHAKCEELAAALGAESDTRSPAVMRIKGRSAPEGGEGMTMCLNPKAASALGSRGLSVPKTLCTRCPFRDDCGYLAQEARLKRLAAEPAGVIVVAPMDYAFAPLPGDVKPDLVVFDEAERNLGHLTAALSFDALGEPLTYDGPARRKGAEAEAAEAADAYSALLSTLRPLRVAIRDAFQETPAGALRTLRERGMDAARIERALEALHDFEDRIIGERLGREIDAHHFAGLNGRALNLDNRLLAAIDTHHDKGMRDFRRLCEALLLELAHGRDEPVAVLRADNVNPPRIEGPPRQGVVAHLLREPHFGAELPFLHLDGSGDHRMAEQLFGSLRLEWHPVERPARVVQVLGRNFSRQSITGIDSRGEPMPSRQAEAARLRAELVAYCHAQPVALVVASKRVIEALAAAGLRNPVAHFGALRGRNAWEGLGAVIVIGREQPSPQAVEAIARAYAARAGDLFNSLDGAAWSVEPRGLRMRDRSAVAVEVETHPDPWASRVLAQIREGEALQAIDRVRPHFKEADPVRVTLLGQLVLDITVDRVERWREAKEGGSKVERALASRVLPLSESEATRAFPGIWPNRKAAQRDEEMRRIRARLEGDLCLGQSAKRTLSLENVPGKAEAVLASYLRASEGGRGGSQTVFRALILAPPEEAKAVLEAILGGPVEGFLIEARTPPVEAPQEPMQVPAASPAGAVIVRLPEPRPLPVQAPPAALRPAAGAGPP